MKRVLGMCGGFFLLISCMVSAKTIPPEVQKPAEIVETIPIRLDASYIMERHIRHTKDWDKETSDSTITVSYPEAQQLMRIASAEALNQGTIGMFLVMQVVWNRVQSPLYPNTVWEVISQPGQFDPVMNGTYYTAEITPETHEALALFESNLQANEEIIAFESVRNDSLTRYFDTSFTYLGHTFYHKKRTE